MTDRPEPIEDPIVIGTEEKQGDEFGRAITVGFVLFGLLGALLIVTSVVAYAIIRLLGF